MRLLRKTSIFLCLASLLLLLGACHGKKDAHEFEIPGSLDTSKNLEITFWAKNDTNKTQTKIYEQAIRDFESYYPNITVNLRLYTDYGKIYNDVITNISTGTTPNVCITYPDHIATYLTGEGTVVPLDSLMEDERYGLGGSEVLFDAPTKAEMIPEFLSECAIGGRTYALPFMRSTEACYVNADLVEKLGYTLPETLTWDFVWEVSEAAMEKDAEGYFKVNGQKVMIPFIYKSTDNMMIQLLAQRGGDYSTSRGDILIFNDTTKAILQEIAGHAATGSFSTFKISSYPGNFLNAGQCIFAVDSTAGATWMGTGAPNMDIAADKVVSFETKVYPVPQSDPEHPKMISQGPSVCVFNKEDPQEVLASWLFVQFLVSNSVQIAYSETEGYVPVTSKAQGSGEYKDYLWGEHEADALHYEVKLSAAKMLLEHTSDTFVTPVFNGSASLRDAAGQMIENVVKSVRRKETVDEAYYATLYSQIESLYHLDRGSLGGGAGAEADLGEMPAASKALLISLAAIWIILGGMKLISLCRGRNGNRET